MKFKSASIFKVYFFTAAILVSLWTGVAWTNRQAEQQGLEDLRRETAALALLFANHTDTTFRAVDLALLALREHWLRDPPDPGMDYKAHLALLDSAVVQVGVIDAQGYAVYSSLGLPQVRLYLGDREHFKVDARKLTVWIGSQT